MENPATEIPNVISLLTQSAPDNQQQTIERYFTPNAEFSHPFCRVWSSADSRRRISMIYKWYKIMSPRIELNVHSVAFDEEHLKLYVSLTQVFSIWAIPFHTAAVDLTTVLFLTTDPNGSTTNTTNTTNTANTKTKPASNNETTRYYISKQDDLYQTGQFVKFLLPYLGFASLLVDLAQSAATLFCILGVYCFWPFHYLERQGLIPGFFLAGGNVAQNIGNVAVANGVKEAN